jgi:DNA-binding MarR family transcriptional regulator
MDIAPAQSQAHLIVAAVRVLGHKTGRPAAVEEVADLLGWSKELAGHLIRALEKHGIVRTIKSPFDVRVEVADHLAVEKLPKEDAGPGLQDEVEEFHERFKKKQEQLQNLFDSGELDEKRKQRLAGLDKELRDFKSPRRTNPFGDEGGG